MKSKNKQSPANDVASTFASYRKSLSDAFNTVIAIIDAAERAMYENAVYASMATSTDKPKRGRRKRNCKSETGSNEQQTQKQAVTEQHKDAVTRVHRTPKSVRLTPHEITLNIGSFPVKDLAEADAKDLLNNPRVFWYRAMQFPDPRRYSVQPRVECVKVIKREEPKFTRSPWTVSVTIHVDGDDKRTDSWGVGVLARNKGDQEQ